MGLTTGGAEPEADPWCRGDSGIRSGRAGVVLEIAFRNFNCSLNSTCRTNIKFFQHHLSLLRDVSSVKN